MQETTKKNLPLILGLSIPVAMIILIAGFIYIPRWSAPKPMYNFLYMIPENGYYGYYTTYTVVNNHLVKTENLPPTTDPLYKPAPADTVHFYTYDTTTNQAREISFQEAQSVQLNSNPVSKDGYEVVTNYGGDVFPFGGSRDYGSKYLKGHNTAKKLNIPNYSYNYYDFRFLGWIN